MDLRGGDRALGPLGETAGAFREVPVLHVLLGCRAQPARPRCWRPRGWGAGIADEQAWAWGWTTVEPAHRRPPGPELPHPRGGDRLPPGQCRDSRGWGTRRVPGTDLRPVLSERSCRRPRGGHLAFSGRTTRVAVDKPLAAQGGLSGMRLTMRFVRRRVSRPGRARSPVQGRTRPSAAVCRRAGEGEQQGTTGGEDPDRRRDASASASAAGAPPHALAHLPPRPRRPRLPCSPGNCCACSHQLGSPVPTPQFLTSHLGGNYRKPADSMFALLSPRGEPGSPRHSAGPNALCRADSRWSAECASGRAP